MWQRMVIPLRSFPACGSECLSYPILFSDPGLETSRERKGGKGKGIQVSWGLGRSPAAEPGIPPLCPAGSLHTLLGSAGQIERMGVCKPVECSVARAPDFPATATVQRGQAHPGKETFRLLSAHAATLGPQRQLFSSLGRTFPARGQLVFMERSWRRREGENWIVGLGGRSLCMDIASLGRRGVQAGARAELWGRNQEASRPAFRAGCQGWGDEECLWPSSG